MGCRNPRIYPASFPAKITSTSLDDKIDAIGNDTRKAVLKNALNIRIVGWNTIADQNRFFKVFDHRIPFPYVGKLDPPPPPPPKPKAYIQLETAVLNLGLQITDEPIPWHLARISNRGDGPLLIHRISYGAEISHTVVDGTILPTPLGDLARAINYIDVGARRIHFFEDANYQKGLIAFYESGYNNKQILNVVAIHSPTEIEVESLPNEVQVYQRIRSNYTGTINFNSTTTVTGNGTKFKAQLVPGASRIIYGGHDINIASIESDTSLTLESAMPVSISGTTLISNNLSIGYLSQAIVFPGQQKFLAINWSPTTPYFLRDTVWIASNAENAHSMPLYLSGRSGDPPPPLLPNIEINPTSIDFGSQSVGSSSPWKQVTITNTGAANLTVNSIDLPPGIVIQQTDSNIVGASPMGNLPKTLVPGEYRNIAFAWNPANSGDFGATIVINSNANNDVNLELPCVGTANAAVVIVPPVSPVPIPSLGRLFYVVGGDALYVSRKDSKKLNRYVNRVQIFGGNSETVDRTSDLTQERNWCWTTGNTAFFFAGGGSSYVGDRSCPHDSYDRIWFDSGACERIGELAGSQRPGDASYQSIDFDMAAGASSASKMFIFGGDSMPYESNPFNMTLNRIEYIPNDNPTRFQLGNTLTGKKALHNNAFSMLSGVNIIGGASRNDGSGPYDYTSYQQIEFFNFASESSSLQGTTLLGWDVVAASGFGSFHSAYLGGGRGAAGQIQKYNVVAGGIANLGISLDKNKSASASACGSVYGYWAGGFHANENLIYTTGNEADGNATRAIRRLSPLDAGETLASTMSLKEDDRVRCTGISDFQASFYPQYS